MHDFYSKLGESGLKNNVSFDIYLASTSTHESLDLASLSKCVKATGGDLIYYPNFSTDAHGTKFYYELFRGLTRIQASNVHIKARCTTGFTVTEYFGHFGLREAVDFQLASIDSDKSFGFVLRNDQKMPEGTLVFVQVAMLYTNIYGETRLRVFNHAFPVVKSINSYFKACVAENYC